MRDWDGLSLSLAEFGASLAQAPDEATLAGRYLDGIARYMPHQPAAGIYLLDAETGRPVDVCTFGVSDYFLALYEQVGRARDPVLETVRRTGRAAFSSDLMPMDDWRRTETYREVMRLHRIDHLVEAPVVAGGRIAGTLNFGRDEGHGPFDDLERALAATLGRIVGLALASVRERQAAHREAQRLRTALDLVGQAVVVTDLATAERIANPAARALLERLEAAGGGLDELLAERGRASGDVVVREAALPADDAGPGGTLHCRATRPSEQIEVCFLDLVRGGERPPPAVLDEPLTPREREVARLAAAGLADKEIAARLYLSPHTVKGYMKACYRKLGVNSRVALARLPHV